MEYLEFTLKDEAYSGEEFRLTRDENGVLRTSPKPKDLARYYNFSEYISHQKKNKTLLKIIYDRVKKRMFHKKLKLLLGAKKNINSVLDFGCGTGDFIAYLNKKNIDAEGVEPTALAYNTAKERQLVVYKTINECGEGFDVITLFHVLEHVDNYEKTLNQLLNKLNPNGMLLIAVPNYESYDAKYYKEKWAAWDVPRHLWHFNRDDIRKLGQRHNLELIKIKPMHWDAFYISMVSESYRRQSKILGLYRGLLSNSFAFKTKEYSSNLFLFQKRT